MLTTKNTDTTAIPIYMVTAESYEDWRAKQSKVVQTWLLATHFSALASTYQLLADGNGNLTGVVASVDVSDAVFAVAALVGQLPSHTYELVEPLMATEHLALGWALAGYRFVRYKENDKPLPTLAVDAGVLEKVMPQVTATTLVRDLINTPAEDMGPENLSLASKTLANTYGAGFEQWVGDVLLKKNFPAIHAVGRAGSEAPRLIKLNWGKADAPHVVLVGKGVCFDTGGLNLKPDKGMRYMKKDMGGAAHVLGLASLIMQADLPVHLTVLIPAVENSVAGNAIRPGDVIPSRSGQTIEIGNTDAEGRVILADALTYAMEKNPDVLVDFATLTGAARVALGPSLPALFSNDMQWATQVVNEGCNQHDLLWQLPLFSPYRRCLDSTIANISNDSSMPYGGAITAALFLQSFVGDVSWLHIDVMAWNLKTAPGRPEGGEAMGMRAVFAALTHRFGREL